MDQFTNVVSDSRLVTPGALFIAIPGVHQNGARYITEARNRGAKEVWGTTSDCDRIIENPRETYANCCAEFFDFPSRKMFVCGITGTNGKTTTSLLLKNMLAQGGLCPGLITTVETQWPGYQAPSQWTTPEAYILQETFKKMVATGCRAVVMEVSSHAIDQARIAGTQFAVTLFTNLTQDHLDYHKTMEDYFAVKAKFFLDQPQAPAVINIDDPYGQRLLTLLKEQGRTNLYPYSIKEINATFTSQGIEAIIPIGDRKISFRTRLCGRYNLSNILCAATAAHALGVSADAILMAICEAKPQWGRLEPILPNVFIDYAHTDDALRNVLATLKECCKGRLICVFGCGGDRDKTKRPRMASAVEDYADVVYVTSDNPRSESPLAIIQDILPGFTKTHPFVEPDRRLAIQKAMKLRQLEDIILIAGKGHEPYQEIMGVKYPYSDTEAILQVDLKEKAVSKTN